jgi:thioredoxin reductase
MFDVVIIGGGVSGVSCALILGSAVNKPFASNKKIGILTHQKASALQDAIFYNAYGIPSGTTGADLLNQSIEQLANNYPHVEQMAGEKVLKLEQQGTIFIITTNKNTYSSRYVVVSVGNGNPFPFEGLEDYVIPHQKALPSKNRLQLKNEDHLVFPGLYVSGTVAGHRSQFSIAAGSGAAVATDLLTLWNEGQPVQVHDSLRK